MSGKITQVRFSGGVKFFKQDFMQCWRLRDYHDRTKPALFVGMYKDTDIEALRRHKGFKVVWLTGADKKNASRIIDDPNTIFKVDDQWLQWMMMNVKRVPAHYKKVRLAIKDYSAFKPTALGNKVYCYVGKGHNSGKFEEHLIRQIAAKSGFEFLYGIQGQSMDRMISRYYSECFVSLRLNPLAGGTTATELAMMGRRSISNRDEPWYIRWDTVDDVVEKIKYESQLIGITPKSFISDDYFVGEEWKQVQFWK